MVRLSTYHFIVGKYYLFNKKYYEFVKSTRKGYNFKSFITDKYMLKRHIYATNKYSGKILTFLLPTSFHYVEAKNPNEIPEQVEKRKEFLKVVSSPKIFKEVGIGVDENGNIIN